MVFNRFEKMKKWVGEKVALESRLGNSCGRVLYGVRVPMVSQLNTLRECKHGSKEKIEGERPGYYFVSEEHEGLKIPLVIYSINSERIMAIGRSAGNIFYTTLRRDYNEI